jgi:hypothetical protein
LYVYSTGPMSCYHPSTPEFLKGPSNMEKFAHFNFSR